MKFAFCSGHPTVTPVTYELLYLHFTVTPAVTSPHLQNPAICSTGEGKSHAQKQVAPAAIAQPSRIRGGSCLPPGGRRPWASPATSSLAAALLLAPPPRRGCTCGGAWQRRGVWRAGRGSDGLEADSSGAEAAALPCPSSSASRVCSTSPGSRGGGGAAVGARIELRRGASPPSSRSRRGGTAEGAAAAPESSARRRPASQRPQIRVDGEKREVAAIPEDRRRGGV
jgi:hypothetical protein